MVDMINKVLINSVLFSFLFLIGNAYAVTYSEKMEQIFNFNESDIVHIKFIDTINASEALLSSNSFRFGKSMDISNLYAYDITTKDSLNYTITDSGNFTRITVNFPAHSSYTFALEFDYKNPYKPYTGINRFYWRWGGASYPIELKYTFRLPPENLIIYSSKDYTTLIEGRNTILVIEGNAPANESFDFLFDYKKVGMPKISINKLLSKTSIIEGETTVVTLIFTNIGESVAKNVTIKDPISGIFSKESGNNEWYGDLESGETQSFEYTLRGKASSENRLLGSAEVTYTDFWGSNTFRTISNDITISVKNAPDFLDFGLFKLPVPSGFSQVIIYNFFIGYGILMWVFLLRKKDYKTWKDIPFFDKVIYSFITSGINVVLTVFPLILILMFKQNLLFIKNIEYVIFLIPVYPTVLLVEKLIKNISNKKVYLTFYFLVGLLLLILYFGIRF